MSDSQFVFLNHPNGVPKTMAELELEIIRRTINRTGSKNDTAKTLDIGRSTLYRKLAKMEGRT